MSIHSEDAWYVLDAFFRAKGMAHVQLDSYNDFMDNVLQEIVSKTKPHAIEIESVRGNQVLKRKYEVNFGRVTLRKPQMGPDDVTPMFPMEARLRELSYSASLYIDMQQIATMYENGVEVSSTTTDFKQVFVGNIPVMVRSKYCQLYQSSDSTAHKECDYDEGGYFIVNGSEKVIVAQERLAPNRVFCYERKHGLKFSHVAEIRSSLDAGDSSTSPLYVGYAVTSGQLLITLPFIRDHIPACVVMRALGVITDRDMYNMVTGGDEVLGGLLSVTIDAASSVRTQAQALELIGKRCAGAGSDAQSRVERARTLLTDDVLPHCGTSLNEKAYFVGYMMKRVLQARSGLTLEDDRDHVSAKRVEVVGPLFAMLFRPLFKKFAFDTQEILRRTIDVKREASVLTAVNPTTITNGFKYCIVTGKWALQRQLHTYAKVGVSQQLSRLSHADTLSHLRRLNLPARTGKLTKPRQQHHSQWGYVCPTETPEGIACGLLKNFSLTCCVTVRQHGSDLSRLLRESVIPLHEEPNLNDTAVFFNGAWIGTHPDPVDFVRTLRDARRQGIIHEHTSIAHLIPQNELHICSEEGRCVRPLFVVRNQQLVITRDHIEALQRRELDWDDLIRQGCLEFVDSMEESTCMIAMRLDALYDKHPYSHTYTHSEIHPSIILGVCASMIPFPDHNQSPRNTYQSSMGKQAAGLNVSNFRYRMDALAHLLDTPQKPLVATKAMKYLFGKELPSGTNSIVAIACYTGFNQEDSLILNQGAIDRGFQRITSYRSHVEYEEVDKATQRRTLAFEHPSPITTLGTHDKNYNTIDSDGLPQLGQRINKRDVLVGKTAILPQPTPKGETHKDHSLLSTNTGIVDRVMLSSTESGNRLTKIRVRTQRIPEVGDKFSSCHGQKGTVGLILPASSMPFTQEGITPDIIMNPHAVPSRMTIGQLIECVLAKVAALTGTEGDATPFSPHSIDDVSNLLRELGFQRHGHERLYSGFTGQPLSTLVFIGPTFYQRLKHMVDDKIHARSRGPNTLLTRQPRKGRRHDGGLRFGEMERDCVIAHGATALLRERTLDASDRFKVHVCDHCGLLCEANLSEGKYMCRKCKQFKDISQVTIPYAFKLLVQELNAMCIAPKLIVDKK